MPRPEARALLDETWKRSKGSRQMRWARPGLFIWFLVLAAVCPAAAQQSDSEQIETCLACHGDSSLSVTLPSGEVRSLYIDAEAFSSSVHGSGAVGSERDEHGGLSTDFTDYSRGQFGRAASIAAIRRIVSWRDVTTFE